MLSMNKKFTKADTEIQAVFFDLDGTLIDSFNDLAFALNLLLSKHNKPSIPIQEVKKYVSSGVAGLLNCAFSITTHHPQFSELKEQYLTIYKQKISQQCTSCLYPGITTLLNELYEKAIPWGVVTNKLRHLAEILLEQTKIIEQCRVLVASDDVDKPKPSPQSLLKACGTLRCQPECCVYIGDHQRDIIAGKSAHMLTISAIYGYVQENEDPYRWGATYNAKNPADILYWLEQNQWKQP